MSAPVRDSDVPAQGEKIREMAAEWLVRRSDGENWSDDDHALESGKAECKGEAGPAPLADAPGLARAGENQCNLERDEEKPEHGRWSVSVRVSSYASVRPAIAVDFDVFSPVALKDAVQKSRPEGRDGMTQGNSIPDGDRRRNYASLSRGEVADNRQIAIAIRGGLTDDNNFVDKLSTIPTR